MQKHAIVLILQRRAVFLHRCCPMEERCLFWTRWTTIKQKKSRTTERGTSPIWLRCCCLLLYKRRILSSSTCSSWKSFCHSHEVFSPVAFLIYTSISQTGTSQSPVLPSNPGFQTCCILMLNSTTRANISKYYLVWADQKVGWFHYNSSKRDCQL